MANWKLACQQKGKRRRHFISLADVEAPTQWASRHRPPSIA
ncbi:hypothetical protein PLANPX_3054 [Lacipirellula parvula]|uniref:Uncharacterized protein n=1 Tax=Lacipirellula parvula TaxID=2650471 RepID=A0A5K7XBW5_9BACT|nr:hypothetical protein PLANPX_3054 [Lacipirellula parvula]